MKLIELHILQSYPVSCLNRDDVGSPKTAEFGGVSRARVSSQCLKRAVREYARDHYPAARFNGLRSRMLIDPFTAAFQAAGLDEAKAVEQSRATCMALSKIEDKKPGLVTTAVFLSPGEIAQVATAVAAGAEPAKALKKANRLDAADISLFGRMIANDASLNVEGAAMFSHALSSHAAGNEIDFFSAVDDRKTDESADAGAGMIGTLEFTSALYYRYVGLNLDLLADKNHLGGLDAGERRAVVDAFLRSAVLAVPGARRNTMNADTRPGFVLGLYHDKGQPLQLINAFLRPIKGGGKNSDLLGGSRDALEAHHGNLKRVWGIAPTVEATLTEDGDTTFAQFATELTAHVP